MEKTISVIVVEQDEFYTQRCVNTIRRQEGDGLEIIVIPREETKALAEALKRVTGEAVLLIRNTDVLAPAGLRSLMSRETEGVCRCRMILCEKGSCQEKNGAWSPYGVLWTKEQFPTLQFALAQEQVKWELFLGIVKQTMDIPVVEDACLYTDCEWEREDLSISALINMKQAYRETDFPEILELVELCALEKKSDKDCLLAVTALETELPLISGEIFALETRYVKPAFARLIHQKTSCRDTYDAFRYHLESLSGNEIDMPFILNCTAASLDMIRYMDYDMFSSSLFSAPEDLEKASRARRSAVLRAEQDEGAPKKRPALVKVEKTPPEELYGLALVAFVQDCVARKKLGMRTILRCMCIWFKVKLRRG